MTAARAIAMACICAGLCAGCASRTKSSSTPAGIADFQIIETAAANGSVQATDVFALEPSQLKYRIVEGEGAGSELIISIDATSEHHAAVARAEGEDRTQFLRVEADGRIVMTAVHEAGDDALSVLNPPLVIMPATLAAGEEFSSESDMRVLDAGNLKHVRESGRAVRTIQYSDDQRIRTPLGEFPTRRIVIRFNADLRLAQANEITMLWIAPDIGLVAQQTEEQVKVLGLGGKKKTRTLVLIESP